MLKSHHNLLEPRPADRLRIGERLVDIPLREVSSADGVEPVRITLKSLNVLLTLVAHAGKPVSREALLEWVWPDTLPTDDVLTQAVTQLRKALGDERDRPRYIETIAKQGYRLVAPIEWLPDAGQEPAPATAAPPVAADEGEPPSRARRRWWWAVAAILAMAAVLAYVGSRGSQRASPQTQVAGGGGVAAPASRAQPFEFLRIASRPEAEEAPSLSPDGALVVYSRHRSGARFGASLVIQTASATSPRALTESTEGRNDVWPAWSPDGRWIAFVRVAGEQCKVMEVPAAGGSPRELGDCIGAQPHPVSWYPDGSALIAAGRPGPARGPSDDKALYRMPVATGRWERIQYAKSPSDEDMSPQVSPDGRWIAFHRNVSLGDLWRMPVEGGTPQRLTRLRTNIFGLAWTPDSRRLVFARYVTDGAVVLSALDIASGRVVDYRSGSDAVTNPNISRNAETIVFEAGQSREHIRRLEPADGDKALARSEELFESSGSNTMASPSPDGRQMLFVSDRTGDLRLWWADLEHPDSLRSFEGFTPVARYPAAWRDDSRAALVVGRDRAGVSGLYEIDPAAGRLVRLPLPGGEPVYAAYHPTPGRLLVVADRGEGRLGAVLYDRAVAPWRALAEVLDVSRVAVDARHRRILLASMSTPDIRSADYALGNVTNIDRAVSQRRNRTLTPSPDGAMMMDAIEQCQLSWRPVAVVPGRPGGERCLGARSAWLEAVSMSVSGSALYISVLDDHEVDLGLAPLSRVLGVLDGVPAESSATH